MTAPNSQAVEAAALPDTVAKALRTAFSLGQTYWQQADSEYTSQHKKADVTRHKFQTLVDETVAALSLPQEVAVAESSGEPMARQLIISSLVASKGWTHGYAGAFVDDFAASRAPVALVAEPEHWDKLRRLGWRQYDCKVCGESWGAMSEPETPPMAVGAGGSVGAIPFVGFVARHADRSKTDTTTSVAVDASREQIQDHLAVADSRRVQASNSRVYTDAQLAAGVEALGICRGMGIPLSDETVAGVVYDYMTAAGPKRPLTIYMDEDPIDVEQFYRAKGFEKLPPTPTMTGAEIRACGWKKNNYPMFIDFGNTGKPFERIGETAAVPLSDGMRFVCIPSAYAGMGLDRTVAGWEVGRDGVRRPNPAAGAPKPPCHNPVA